MPLYDYLCPREHKFEKIVPIAQMDETQECPGKLVLAGYGEEDFTIVCCRAPAKRVVVPSRPAHFIMR